MRQREVFEQMLRQVDWIKGIIQNRNWEITQDLIVEGPATDEEIKKVEEVLGVNIPEDYKYLFKLSKHMEFRYEFDEEMPPEFRNNYSGEISWDLNQLKDQLENFNEWVDELLDPVYNESKTIASTQEVWKEKVPLMEVPGGDIIVVGSSPSEVVYFSIKGHNMHGRKLGNNLWEFLEFHSKVGFAGSEDWQLEPFYEFRSDKMIRKEDSVEKFIEWLNKL